MKRKPRALSACPLLAVFFVACGGGSSGSTTVNTPSTAGDAQDVYAGTTSTGFTFLSIVLPNDTFYGLYGVLSGDALYVNGMITGPGASGSSTYTANTTNFEDTGAVVTGSVSATYVPQTSVSGTVTQTGVVTSTFTGTDMPSGSYNYNTGASLSAVTGEWSGMVLNGSTATVTINANGTLTGSSTTGCTFSGTIAADSSGKNFFDVSITLGNSACSAPNQSASGIAVDYFILNGTETQFVMAITEGSSWGTVFFAHH
jgi:hypothetical protein